MSDQLDHNKSPQIESSSKRDTTQKQASSESNQAMSNGSSDEDISQCVSRGIKGLTISNWSETFKCSPELYFIPQDVEEIREVRHDRAVTEIISHQLSINYHILINRSYY